MTIINNKTMPSRIAIIDYDKCKPKKCNNECGMMCPINRQGKECIKIVDIEEIGQKAKISSDLCIGCGMCVKKCPFNAISIINLPKELDENELLYSYGENSFRIYKCPSVKKGHCVGILGANGLGKSTILKIMANEIHVDHKLFVGDELFKYMCLLKEGKIKISYKSQEIGKYHKMKDTVCDFVSRDFLESKYVQEFQLSHLLTRKLDQLSGGELQRLLIGLACNEKADSYIFDEPSAFLDIKQRIIASNLILEKCTPDTYVVCVEHDLCILDYICDYVCCLYGYTNGYGVVTSVQGVRNGINSYLEGYFKKENMKFRNEPIHFNKYLVNNIINNPTCIYEYKDFSINYDQFKLSANSGKINLCEITLLLGENGTGKTSFIKHLEKSKDIITSIKIQNPYIQSNLTVREYLEKNINGALSNHSFVSNIIEGLKIHDLYDLNVSALSGGQMQKLSIVSCLGKDANLYLLDEPSAFIDIEDRCGLAKIIKKFTYDYKKTVFIIEHDITLATNIADKVIIFDGISGIKCTASEPYDLHTGINKFLKNIDVTMRKDGSSGRHGINKNNSQKDTEQKKSGIYYIIE